MSRFEFSASGFGFSAFLSHHICGYHHNVYCILYALFKVEAIGKTNFDPQSMMLKACCNIERDLCHSIRSFRHSRGDALALCHILSSTTTQEVDFFIDCSDRGASLFFCAVFNLFINLYIIYAYPFHIITSSA